MKSRLAGEIKGLVLDRTTGHGKISEVGSGGVDGEESGYTVYCRTVYWYYWVYEFIVQKSLRKFL